MLCIASTLICVGCQSSNIVMETTNVHLMIFFSNISNSSDNRWDSLISADIVFHQVMETERSHSSDSEISRVEARMPSEKNTEQS